MSPRYLTIDEVRAIHAAVVTDARGGGADGVLDEGLLASATMAPQTGYYGSLADLAAAYAHGLAKNHAFLDGNKRTALVASLVFLTVNGHLLTREVWLEAVEGLASGTVPRRAFRSLVEAEMGIDDPPDDEETSEEEEDETGDADEDLDEDWLESDAFLAELERRAKNSEEAKFYTWEEVLTILS